ncbi:MAG TPA: NAD/NADP octopine/nopaline dehydrogenase family protein [Actinomycetota bacterium]|nr:NAD/NADP octopine/nopaline dehydrogenase family protein [Actinomycetota bacterium]
MKVAVVGVGVGGSAVAAHAALQGHEVRVCDVRPDAVEPIAATGGIRVSGKEEGFAAVSAATLDPRVALAGADVVFLVTQGQDQGAAAASISRHLGSARLLVVMPGGTGGALEVRGAVRAGGADVPVAETDSFPFGCSIPEAAASNIASVKQRFRVAVLPAGGTAEAVALVREVFAQAEPAESVLETSLSNMNAILHVAPMVTNAGRIEHEGGSFDFYGDGVTRSVAKLVAAMDRERRSVAGALGVAVPSLLEWIQETYGVAEPDEHAAIQRLHREVYGPMPAPTTLEHRYLLEDVPCGAVPVASLGSQLGVPAEVTDRCIELASTLVGVDLRATGRTAERLGLGGLSAAQIRDAVMDAPP